MTRLLAALLAAFLCGPTCLCLASGETAAPDARGESCCRVLIAKPTPAKAPAPTCGCSKCLAKRTFANEPAHIPDVAWIAAVFPIFDGSHVLSVLAAPVPTRLFVTGSGPPRIPRAELVRHRALLL